MATERDSQDLLSADIHLLGDILGKVIRRQAGIDIFELEERIRSLTKVRRADDESAEQVDTALRRLVDSLSIEDAEGVARAFTLYFELVNLAEETHRVRVLRERFGTVHVNVGEPIRLDDLLNEAMPAWRQQRFEDDTRLPAVNALSASQICPQT